MESSISPPPSSVQNRSSRISYREDSNDRSGQSLSPYRNSSRAPLFRQQQESRSSSSRPRISEDVPQDKEKQPAAQAAAPATPEESRGPLAILRQDYRASLPPILARFTGYRPKDKVGPLYPPIWPLKWLTRIPIKYEIWLFGWIGAFVSIVLVEAVMSASALFQQYQVPLIIGSFGASAVLIYGMSDAPVSQPRNVVGGQVLSALTAVIITRLFSLRPGYTIPSDTVVNNAFDDNLYWLNSALSMATCLTVMHVTGTLHPPGGATAILGSILPAAVELQWKYLLVIFVSSILMMLWGVLWMNLGRRRYPVYWWSPKPCFVKSPNQVAAEREALQREKKAGAMERVEESVWTGGENAMERGESEGRTADEAKAEAERGRQREKRAV